ncbi:glycosyl hydrolase family 18 protein [Aliibacillus thermotolerans]|uniref:Glycosyl hydrolase family 18 protein n=1 Tax=Aliibacillus thermotolerans TaxID=1834418 RepID=A0ABW0U561_9BACI|nr:glycosyl hydrolase family 18 protein [Aliibacillus thermotolerans]MDA3129137.1 LysM peptidoglycan-binding domain-containing protein [Aliibacillus thermotolerans]
MFVYTVKSGDSLFQISQKYQVSIDELMLINGLTGPDLVPGQSIIVHRNIYIVQPGDTWESIAQMAYVSVHALRQQNPTVGDILYIGMQIIIPEQPAHVAATLSYLYITGTERDARVIRDFAPYTTYYGFFEYHLTPEGNVSSLNDLRAIEAAWNSGSTPLATITNLTETGFNPDIVSKVLRERRGLLVEEIARLVMERGYGGVNIDFEQIVAEDRDLFTIFLRELRERLVPLGRLVTVAVPPKTEEDISWLRGFDYGGIGASVDYMFIMAYDWHYFGSEPGPVAPIENVKETIDYALTKTRAEKILLGVALYGYDWPVDGGEGKAISLLAAQNIAIRNGAVIQFDEESKTPYFYYVDHGTRRVVWFEDSKSLSFKMKLVQQYRLGGIGGWQIGLNFPQGPWLLTHFLNVE